MQTATYNRPWLYEKQLDALFHDQRLGIVEASTKSGKTVGCMAWLFEQAAIRGSVGRNYWWVAPTYEVAGIAFRRMKLAVPRTLYTGNGQHQTITLANGATIWFKGADKPDGLYGEDVYAAVIDEASRVKEEAWHAVRSTLTATRGPVRIIGNVKGRQNWAYRLARKAESGAKDMRYRQLTAYDAVEGGVLEQSEVASAKDTLPEHVFNELYLNQPTDDGGNPFGLKAIQGCLAPKSEHKPAVWGWDFARAQDWTVGIALDAYGHVCQVERWQGKLWDETKRIVADRVKKTPSVGDSTGIGDVIVESIQFLGTPMTPFVFTPKSKQGLMERLAVAIQGRQVHFPEGVVSVELETFGYEYTASGVRYSAPEGLHDDAVMALALAVYGYDRLGPHVEAWEIPRQTEGRDYSRWQEAVGLEGETSPNGLGAGW